MISVVMPAYNAARFIEPAIQSILTQTYTQFELIVVDDGSTDDTLAIIRTYAKRDPRVKVIQHQHLGQSAAMNAAMQQAIYPWVAIMHADDIAMPERLERQWQMAQTDPNVVIWGTDGYHVNSKGERLSVFRVGPTTKAEFDALRAKGEIVQVIHPTALLNREIALKVGGYDTRLNVCEDIELFDRMAQHGYLLAIPERLLGYRVHGQSLSTQKFLTQRFYIEFVMARQQARLRQQTTLRTGDTQPDLTLDQFRQEYNQRPWLQRFWRTVRDLSRMYYRRAGMAIGERDYPRVVLYLGLSGLLNPIYGIKRIWQQVVAPKFKGLLK